MVDPMESMANSLLGHKTKTSGNRRQRKKPMIQISIRLPVPVWQQVKSVDPLQPHGHIRKIVCAVMDGSARDILDLLKGPGPGDAEHAG